MNHIDCEHYEDIDTGEVWCENHKTKVCRICYKVIIGWAIACQKHDIEPEIELKEAA